MPRYAMRIKALKAPRDEIETETEEMADALHLHILTSMPGIVLRLHLEILLNNGLGDDFDYSVHDEQAVVEAQASDGGSYPYCSIS